MKNCLFTEAFHCFQMPQQLLSLIAMGLKSKFREFEFELRFSRDLIRNLRVKEFDLKHLFSRYLKRFLKLKISSIQPVLRRLSVWSSGKANLIEICFGFHCLRGLESIEKFRFSANYNRLRHFSIGQSVTIFRGLPPSRSDRQPLATRSDWKPLKISIWGSLFQRVSSRESLSSACR